MFLPITITNYLLFRMRMWLGGWVVGSSKRMFPQKSQYLHLPMNLSPQLTLLLGIICAIFQFSPFAEFQISLHILKDIRIQCFSKPS